jgi:hypothetical protein
LRLGAAHFLLMLGENDRNRWFYGGTSSFTARSSPTAQAKDKAAAPLAIRATPQGVPLGLKRQERVDVVDDLEFDRISLHVFFLCGNGRRPRCEVAASPHGHMERMVPTLGHDEARSGTHVPNNGTKSPFAGLCAIEHKREARVLEPPQVEWSLKSVCIDIRASCAI